MVEVLFHKYLPNMTKYENFAYFLKEIFNSYHVTYKLVENLGKKTGV